MKLVLVQPQLDQRPGRQNLDRILDLIEGSGLDLGADDIVLFPEHFDMRAPKEAYEAGIREAAQRLGCAVVGGSHHETRDGAPSVNRGIAVDATGTLLGEYEKLRPYADERRRVAPGAQPGELSLAGRRVLVLICADFWFSDLFERARTLPDLVLVPALSVTRKATPAYSRTLWRHLAVARAYEFGAFVGISDWGHPSELPALRTSGVGGLADPTTTDPGRFFTPIGEQAVRAYDIDFDALEAFRADRLSRGFFWKDG